MSTAYKATHTDQLTRALRDKTWRPWKFHHCGCDPTVLCKQHAGIRAAEHYNPELIP